MTWEALNAAGTEAYERGDYAEAEKQFGAALEEAEGFGPRDLRLATTLYNLAELYGAQVRHVEAEPLYKQARAPSLGAAPTSAVAAALRPTERKYFTIPRRAL